MRVYKKYRRCAAMGGGDGETAALQIPGAVSDGCPAFADGCPYSKNDEMLEWIKAHLHKRPSYWLHAKCTMSCGSDRRSDLMRSGLALPSRKGPSPGSDTRVLIWAKGC